MKVLVLGHGWRMWNERYTPRCAPMELEEWNALVQDVSKETLTFLDFCKEEEPDIWENMGNDWCHQIHEPYSYDFVVDATSPLASLYRRSKYYWEGVKHALKDDGVLLGWNDDPKAGRRAKIKLNKSELDSHILNTYGKLKTPQKLYETFC